jgi:hypothetical protein
VLPIRWSAAVTTATATTTRPAFWRSLAAPLAIGNRLAGWLICLLPGLLTAYLGLNWGGRGADVTAVGLLVLTLLLAGRLALVRRPLAGISPPLMVAACALLLFAAWTSWSSAWSDAPIRATVEFQRVALYTVALVFFGAFLRRPGGLALAVRGLAVAIAGICVVGLATRLYPDVYAVDTGLSVTRLAYPLGYWNGLGLLAGVGLVLMLHLACDVLEPRLVRALAAGGVPIAATALYFTFSRGATGAAALGILVYLIVGRPRGAIAGLIASAPATFLAVHSAYGADLLGTEQNATAAAAVQGHRVAVTLLICSAAAMVARLVLTPLDARLSRARLSAGARRQLLAVAAGVVLLGLCAAVVLDAPERISTAWDSFTQPEEGGDARSHLRSVTLSGRQEHWDVAISYFQEDRIRGAGAGSFELQWLRSRPSYGAVTNAHSLYIEVLGELGLVGLILLGAGLGTLLVALARRASGRRRPLFAAIFAGTLTWAVHAGVDWDWELAAVSFWVFALAGMALARTTPSPPRASGGVMWILRAGAGVLCLLVAVGAVRMIVSTDSLARSISAFKSGDCKEARDHAETSLDALGSQPQAEAVLGYCDALGGRERVAIAEMKDAVRLDPHHWRYRYGLAVVRGMAGLDPRSDLAVARRLNPRGELLSTGVPARLADARRARWRSLSGRAPRPVD